MSISGFTEGTFHTDPRPAAGGSSWILPAKEQAATSHPAKKMLKHTALEYFQSTYNGS